MRFSVILFFLLLVSTTGGWAQEPESPESIEEDLIDEMLSEAEEEFDYSEISTRLQYFESNPIDLNKADERELSALIFLSPLQINAILEHRRLSGDFVSLYELQAVPGLDENTIRRLLPFLTLGNKPASIPDLKSGSHDLMLRYGRVLEQQLGYLRREEEASGYLGSPDRLLLRYRFRPDKRMLISLNAEKDAGEPFWGTTGRKGFDFYSGALYLADLGRVKRVVVGDYSLQIGQGLTMWSGLSFGKGSLVQNVARQGQGVRAYTSTNESQFLRGAAATLAWGRLEITPFISYKRADASLSDDSSHFSNLQESGYHRTATELKNRKSVLQQVYGLDVNYRWSNFHLGATASGTLFDKTMVPNSQLYNRFRFEGNRLHNASIYYSYTFRNVYGFGEAAHRLGGGFAVLNGIITSLSHRLSLVVLHRGYERNFYTVWGQGFAENSESANERGLYAGLIWNPSRRFEWVAFADYFRFPWLKYRVDAPSEGVDLFSQWTFQRSKSERYSIRLRYRSKAENENLGRPVHSLAEVKKWQIRGQAQYRLNHLLESRNRLEVVRYNKGSAAADYGYLLSQDVFYKPERGPLSGNIRFAYFQTDSYNARLYAFENDVLYASSSPAYHGRGIRFYSNLRWRIRRHADLWVRYAAFFYKEAGIGSALDFIEGKRKSDIKIQLRLQF